MIRITALAFLTMCSTVPDPELVGKSGENPDYQFKEQCPVQKPICIRWEVHPDHLKCTKVMAETKTYDEFVDPPCQLI